MSSKPLLLDYRSDTLTRPTDEMFSAMRAAELGDDASVMGAAAWAQHEFGSSNDATLS